jgi:hypothetical protein
MGRCKAPAADIIAYTALRRSRKAAPNSFQTMPSKENRGSYLHVTYIGRNLADIKDRLHECITCYPCGYALMTDRRVV